RALRHPPPFPTRRSSDLIEIPTLQDIHDNIVAFWVPDALPPPGEPFEFAYRLSWYGNDPQRPPGGRAVATRRDRGTYEDAYRFRSEEHTSELQSRENLVC